jgi:nucleotidyltransferase substrate binding protein (TIGR01987 family)
MKRIGLWEIFIMFLSIYVIIELGYEIIFPLTGVSIKIINDIDFVICIIFLGDFFYFLFKTDDKKAYFKKYWIDLIASIPFMTFLRFFRLTRVIRIIRLSRGIKAIIPIVRKLGTSKSQNILIAYVSILILVLFYCSLAFFECEKEINNNVHTFFDAFWWAFVSITTIGYGDIYPITTEGRIIGMILILFGLGLFSIITAELATKFMKLAKNKESIRMISLETGMNSMEETTTWKQRISNFQKALKQLQKFINKGSLSELEEQGLIQAFEYTYELAWKVMKDYFEYQGNTHITGSRDAITEAHQNGLIEDGEGWMKMIKSRNKSSHTYNEETVKEIKTKIFDHYFELFVAFNNKINSLH